MAERYDSNQEHALVDGVDDAVLAEQADFHPNAAVAVIVMDEQIQGREAVFSIGADNVEEIGLLASQFLATPDGPLVAKSKLVTVAEAMLIRSFPESLNIEYQQFPRKDAPALVKELRAAGNILAAAAALLLVSLGLAPIEGEHVGRNDFSDEAIRTAALEQA